MLQRGPGSRGGETELTSELSAPPPTPQAPLLSLQQRGVTPPQGPRQALSSAARSPVFLNLLLVILAQETLVTRAFFLPGRGARSGLGHFIEILAAAREAHSDTRMSSSSRLPPPRGGTFWGACWGRRFPAPRIQSGRCGGAGSWRPSHSSRHIPPPAGTSRLVTSGAGGPQGTRLELPAPGFLQRGCTSTREARSPPHRLPRLLP